MIKYAKNIHFNHLIVNLKLLLRPNFVLKIYGYSKIIFLCSKKQWKFFLKIQILIRWLRKLQEIGNNFIFLLVIKTNVLNLKKFSYLKTKTLIILLLWLVLSNKKNMSLTLLMTKIKFKDLSIWFCNIWIFRLQPKFILQDKWAELILVNFVSQWSFSQSDLFAT